MTMMNDPLNLKRLWTAMDGCLVFDITINREPGDGVPSRAVVSCKSGPHESQQISIAGSQPSPFNFKFRSGRYVHGCQRQQTPVHIQRGGYEQPS